MRDQVLLRSLLWTWCVAIAVSLTARADIMNWQNGSVIPGTEGITPGPGLSLPNWNTLSQNLNYADFSGGLDLSNANFEYSAFFAAHFMQANLTDANLSHAELYQADLTGANLTRSNLTSADLAGGSVTNCTFTDAIISNARLGAIGPTTTGFTKEQLYSTASYKNKDLGSIGLSGLDMSVWDFIGQNMVGAGFESANLTGADFTQANLSNAHFDGAANLTGANLTSANLTGVRDLRQLSNAVLRSATLSNADLVNARVDGADFSDTTAHGFTRQQLESTYSYAGLKNLSGINLSSNDLTGWNFWDQDLTGASFANSTLAQTVFFRAVLTDANFTGALVANASLSDVTSHGFTKEQLYSTLSYQTKDLSGIILSLNDLSGWNFAGQNLSSAELASNLTNANLSGANLNDASFTNSVYVFQTTFTGANLTDATIEGADLRGATSGGLTAEQFYSTASYKNRNLSRVDLGENDLSGWDFTGQDLTSAILSFGWIENPSDLTGADFSHANLTGAILDSAVLTNVNLAEAIIRGASFRSFSGLTTSLTKEQLYSTASYKQKDLTGVDLTYNKLAGANLSGQNLQYSNLQYLQLDGGDLSFADARGATGLFSVLHGKDVNVRNLIDNGGTMVLELQPGEQMVIRDCSLPVTVIENMIMADGSILDMVFADEAWGSTMNMYTDVVPDLGGTLRLGFAAGVDPAGLVGTTFNLFNWNGQLPPGEQFAEVSSLPGMVWDFTHLYDTGEVTLVGVPEPATVFLFASAGILARRRRKV